MCITWSVMTQQGRNEDGQFLSKSDENRQVRSIRLTDITWDTLGNSADKRSITRADLIEEWVNNVNNDSFISSDRIKELELQVENLKNNSIHISDLALVKLDKAATLRRITRGELIERLIVSDVFDQKTKPGDDSQLPVTKLAKRLNADPKTVRDYRDSKRSRSLVEWSKSKDIDGKGWDYSPETGMYFQID
jgi:predicted DNA-binding ribbon-helix-helix protein